ncbi:MAG: hypothetical protein KAX49_18275 [Halanaerobiales bacterium]|nr:hypothetical protein [Halanaerobiales bacterium]
MKKPFTLLAILSIIILLLGCQLNSAPIITELNIVKEVVESGEQIQVEVKVSDKENDSLTVNWTVTGGQIVGTGKEVEWKVPTVEGEYTISVKVSDGKFDVSESKTISVIIANHSPSITSLTSEKSIVVASENIIEWQAPDTYGVYSLIVKVSNQFFEVN